MTASRKTPFGRFIRLLFAAVFCLAALAAYLLYGKPPRLPGSSPDKRIFYEVPERTTASELARDLYAKGIIDYPLVFKLVLRATGWQRRIRAGYYYVPARNSVMEMARKLTSGEMATRTVTIPEGETSWQIYALLNRKYFPLDSARFDSLVHSPEFAHSLGIEADGLEGYLYPDTYIMPWRIRERELLTILVSRFREVEAGMPPDSEILRRYGRHGWVTLASIVEREAAVRPEQTRIAGVFYNRLRQGWSLGADPTIRFAVHRMTGPLYTADLDVNSPYNTRRFTGLPPGPICNPGEAALRAALAPEKTKMMFFVAKDDGSREHFFSTTYAEHNAFKAEAAANRKRYAEKLDSLEAALALEEGESPQDKTARDTLVPAAVKVPREPRISDPDRAPETVKTKPKK